MKYLNPKADLTFKRVFGEHPDLIISFLNALLPFEKPEEEIADVVEYLNPELVPLNPLRKDSIVDVRCRDKQGRQFIVEMQMMWTPDYKQRVLFNASKAYVSQLEIGANYDKLQQVYSLNLVNDTFSKGPEYYHDYKIVETKDTREIIEGLRFIFIELPKFTPHNYGDKKMQVLWLRYLTEINEKTDEIPEALLESPEIKKAVAQLRESAFTEAQLLGYEEFWDVVSTLKMQLSSSRKEGLRREREEGLRQGIEQGRKEGLRQGREEGREQGRAEGIEQGREQGLRQGIEKGRNEERIKNARAMKEKGIPDEVVAEITGLPAEMIATL